MDSANEESFTISSQENLLLQIDQPPPSPDSPPPPPPPKKTRFKNLKTTIFLLILVILIAGSIILYSICKNKRKPEQRNAYLSGSAQYYCHLTPNHELCYNSISSIINTTALKSGPGPIFSTSLQIAINELNHTTLSITKSLSSPKYNDPLIGPRLSKCQTLAHDSLSRLNKSLGLLGVDSDIESLTFDEAYSFRAWTEAAREKVGKCLSGLEEIDDVIVMVGGGDEKMGVEEVKLGVEKAIKHINICIWLFDSKDFILNDFYNPFIQYEFDNDYSYDYYYYNFKYEPLVFLYSVMYLFIALLYFLFWRSK